MVKDGIPIGGQIEEMEIKLRVRHRAVCPVSLSTGAIDVICEGPFNSRHASDGLLTRRHGSK